MPDAFDRTFGVEIECFLPEGMTQQAAAQAITHRLGQPCMVESYNHNRRHHWKITTDGSLGDYARGMELVSPPLLGQGGIELVGKACEALADLGATINKKCGFHVHVGIGPAQAVEIARNLVKLYAAYEQPVIDALMPVSRRGSENNYCKSLRSANLTSLARATTVQQVEQSVGMIDRFRKINFASAFSRHGTFEFRQHSGTLESNKARKWVVICLRMVHAAANGKVPMAAVAAATQPSHNRARHGSKSWQIGQMLMRPEGVTGPEICAALGWPSVSIPQQAEICGLQVRTERMGRTVRYFAVGIEAAAQPGTPLNVDGFCALIETTDEEKEYITRRIQDLGGPVQWNA